MTTILQDRERRHIIITGQGPRWVRGVELTEGVLTISRWTDEDLDARGCRPLADYPLDRAVGHFLRHQGGVSDAAARALRDLISN